MHRLFLLAGLAVPILATEEDMGPAAFLWPPDRAWSAHIDNNAPCGSVEGPGKRVQFPLTGGRISLVAQDDSYETMIAISYKNDPRSQSDFTPLTPPIRELDPGHTCLPLPPPPSSIAEGTNATLQVRYTADFDHPFNQLFYACADITFVRAASFDPTTINAVCFNATSPVDVPAPTATNVVPTDLPGHGDNEPVIPGLSPTPEPVDAGKGGGLSKGALAGVVVGSVLGVAVVLGLALLYYREKQKKERLERQRDSGRGVAVDDATV
ncbi:hypothetical protein B0T18DRAFT_436438 [Schizothecium vesticola]|uniref:Copper acquisition factor BIM1-like domain-containing protein n=1 Tax=Schizothecium vesticola TaxID=314040 RepID=A0AA40KB33_9PEZI|nr:hypothetical protein B0T18DRAFT_436438 [Schizothecium vesticola]